MLILNRNGSGKEIYRSIFEEGFKEKLCACINERYWQFCNEHTYLNGKVKSLGGKARTVKVNAWSRKIGKEMPFQGIGNEIVLGFNQKLDEKEARVLALARYGIGRYKNQGFCSLKKS